MLYWVKFIYTAGVSLSCDMVVKRGPSERLSLMFNHSSIKRFFQGLTDWDLFFFLIFCVTLPFLWRYQVLVWHHCHQVITNSSTRQSRPLPFFPRGCTLSKAKTIACCPCHLVRVTSTSAVGKVAKKFQAVAAGAFMLLGYALWFSSKGECSLFCSVLLSCPRVCLLDVSCLLGLTLRSSAPVFCCHQDSLTRGRLAFE